MPVHTMEKTDKVSQKMFTKNTPSGEPLHRFWYPEKFQKRDVSNVCTVKPVIPPNSTTMYREIALQERILLTAGFAIIAFVRRGGGLIEAKRGQQSTNL